MFHHAPHYFTKDKDKRCRLCDLPDQQTLQHENLKNVTGMLQVALEAIRQRAPQDEWIFDKRLRR